MNMNRPADYATSLKEAWEHHSCPRTMCAAYDDDFPGQYCEGHAALLEMVDAHHLYACTCIGKMACEGCEKERRRLRAAIGIMEEGR